MATAMLSGGCLCGAVRFTATPSSHDVGACHCGMCRRWAGGPFLGVQCKHSVHMEDESALQVYASSEWGERVFCKHCGSTLFWRMRKTGETEVALGAFDDPAPFALRKEIFIEAKPGAYSFADQTEKMTGAEVFAAFAPPEAGQAKG